MYALTLYLSCLIVKWPFPRTLSYIPFTSDICFNGLPLLNPLRFLPGEIHLPSCTSFLPALFFLVLPPFHTSYFFTNDCFFACLSHHISVHPFPPALPSIPHTSQMFCPTLPFQNLHEHAHSRSLLQRTVDFSMAFLYCVWNAFFFTFCFTGIFPKIYF